MPKELKGLIGRKVKESLVILGLASRTASLQAIKDFPFTVEVEFVRMAYGMRSETFKQGTHRRVAFFCRGIEAYMPQVVHRRLHQSAPNSMPMKLLVHTEASN